MRKEQLYSNKEKYSNGFVELMWIAPIARYEMVEKTVSDDSVSGNTIE